jgi:hypothetical protein
MAITVTFYLWNSGIGIKPGGPGFLYVVSRLIICDDLIGLSMSYSPPNIKKGTITTSF